ncbi:MAG: acetyltransferase [Peptococcaceae bacterium]|nr:acyltransferase [Thermanaerosceptrum fracticalcis]MBZ4654651.1 acetyltransferase [Peptococcaceae bacterium]
MRRLRVFPVEGYNSLQHWTKFCSPWKVIKNFLIIQLCRYSPSLELKSLLARSFLGMKVGKGVSWGLMAMVDVFWPELITIGDNTIIGYNSTILCHEFLIKELRLGTVEIGANVMIGANATILPGVKIGDGAVVAAGSLVNRDVLAGEFVAGVPIKTLHSSAGGKDAAS